MMDCSIGRETRTASCDGVMCSTASDSPLHIVTLWIGLFISWGCVYYDIRGTIYLTFCQLFVQGTLGNILISLVHFHHLCIFLLPKNVYQFIITFKRGNMNIFILNLVLYIDVIYLPYF